MEYRHGVLGSFSKTKKSFFKVAENDKIKAISESIDIVSSRKTDGKKTLHNTYNKDASIMNNRHVFNTNDYNKVGMKGYLNGDDNEPVEIVKTTFGLYGTIVKYKDKNENIGKIIMHNGKADNVITHRD